MGLNFLEQPLTIVSISTSKQNTLEAIIDYLKQISFEDSSNLQNSSLWTFHYPSDKEIVAFQLNRFTGRVFPLNKPPESCKVDTIILENIFHSIFSMERNGAKEQFFMLPK